MKKIQKTNVELLLESFPLSMDDKSLESLIGELKKYRNDNPHFLHGKRVEHMFSYVAAILGKCSFIKQEDQGYFYSKNQVTIPDYRIVLNDETELFVEVKNCHKNMFKINKDYILKLLTYPGVSTKNFKIAIYWSLWKQWVLLSIDDFDQDSKKYFITITDSLVKNKFSLLGEFIFLATPPLKLEFLMDFSKSRVLNSEGMGEFTIKEVQCHTGRGIVSGEQENEIIFDLICYGLNGSWEEKIYPKLVDNKIEKIIFEYSPAENESNKPNCFGNVAVLAWMSQIIINKYNLLTVEGGKIKTLIPSYREEIFNSYSKIKSIKSRHLVIGHMQF